MGSACAVLTLILLTNKHGVGQVKLKLNNYDHGVNLMKPMALQFLSVLLYHLGESVYRVSF